MAVLHMKVQVLLQLSACTQTCGLTGTAGVLEPSVVGCRKQAVFHPSRGARFTHLALILFALPSCRVPHKSFLMSVDIGDSNQL